MSLFDDLKKMTVARDQHRAAEGTLLKKLQAAPPDAPEISTLKQCLDNALEAQSPKGFSEIQRICSMPIEGIPLSPKELEEWCFKNSLAPAYDSGWRWWEPQARATSQFMTYNGLFAPIGVGKGKTLITLAIAAKAFHEKGISNILLIVPTEVYIQLIKYDISWARVRIPLNIPFHFMGRKALRQRQAIAKSGRSGCYILPYSLLQTKDAAENLNAIKPGLIIADEAHKVSRRSARTRRLFSYIDNAHPMYVPLSGTITRKSVIDYHPSLRAALPATCPLPHSLSMAADWAAVLDSNAFVKGLTGPIRPLVDWAREHFSFDEFTLDTTGFRKAYKYRLNTSPGVVATTGKDDIGTSLIIRNQEIPLEGKGADRLEALVADVLQENKTPNGDEIDHAIHAFKWLFELSSGFYNELIWPTVEEWAKKKNLTEEQANSALERAFVQHAAGQEYARKLRIWISSHARENLDTPMLIGANIHKYGPRDVGTELSDAWHDMKVLEFPEMPERYSRAIKVCAWKIAHAVRWAVDAGTGILWYFHQEIGRWLVEELQAAGMTNLLFCPAGNIHNEKILDVANRDNLIVASATAHGTGKNLQHHSKQLVLQWLRPATVTEQLLGRTHRPGQEAEELIVETCVSTDHEISSLAASLNDALYIHQSTGNHQKLIYANYFPMPRVVPPEVLRERGFQNKLLTPGQREMLKERFGDYTL